MFAALASFLPSSDGSGGSPLGDSLSTDTANHIGTGSMTVGGLNFNNGGSDTKFLLAVGLSLVAGFALGKIA